MKKSSRLDDNFEHCFLSFFVYRQYVRSFPYVTGKNPNCKALNKKYITAVVNCKKAHYFNEQLDKYCQYYMKNLI